MSTATQEQPGESHTKFDTNAEERNTEPVEADQEQHDESHTNIEGQTPEAAEHITENLRATSPTKGNHKGNKTLLSTQSSL